MPLTVIWTLLIYSSLAGAFAILIRAQHRVRGTTLLAPCRWALGSLAALATAQLMTDLAGAMTPYTDAWWFLAATSTFCPGMALLGAKRPQNRPWQWIVASLWLIIALPAIQMLVLGKSGALEPHPALAWFMLLLTMVGLVNSVYSRFAPAVLLAVCSQILILNPFLPGPVVFVGDAGRPWGVLGLSWAIWGARFLSRVPPQTRSFDRVWLDFRHRFGLVWSLRFQEQTNAIAQANGWNLRLDWGGFRSVQGPGDWLLPPEQTRVLRQALKNLLRRFVSSEWLQARMPEEVPDERMRGPSR